MDEPNDGPVLSPNQKRQIEALLQSYLEQRVNDRVKHELRWLRTTTAILGFTSFAAFGAVIIYVLGVLPGHVQWKVQQALDARPEYSRDAINQQYGALAERLEATHGYIDKAQAALERIEAAKLDDVGGKLKELERLFAQRSTAALSLEDVDWKAAVARIDGRCDGLSAELQTFVTATLNRDGRLLDELLVEADFTRSIAAQSLSRESAERWNEANRSRTARLAQLREEWGVPGKSWDIMLQPR